MPSDQNKKRLLNLLKILYQYTDELHPLRAPQLITLLNEAGVECERKAVYRDIECLNDFGLEIMQSTFPPGYYYNERIFEIPELRMLIDSVKSSEFITEKKTAELIDKLKGLTSVHMAAELDGGGIRSRPKNRNEVIYYNIDKLHSAIHSGKMVHFSYYRHVLHQGKPVSRKSHEFTVSPYALIWNDGKYYLVANYAKYDDLSHYRVDRMKTVDILADDVRPLSEVSDFTDEFDDAEYVSRVFEMYAGSDLVNIELKCRTSCLEHIVERFGQRVEYKVLDKDYFTVSVQAVINDGLLSWILAQRGDVEAVQPVELKDKLFNLLENMLSAYVKLIC